MAQDLKEGDIFAFQVPHVQEYNKEPLFSFENYKTQVTILLSQFFEDIVTVQEKVDFLDLVVQKQLKTLSQGDELPEMLKKAIAVRVDQMCSGFTQGIIQDRSSTFRRDASPYSISVPKDLNIEYIQQYIRQRLMPILPNAFTAFYKAPSGPNDSKLISILKKITRLDKHFEEMTPENVLSRIVFHYIEIMTFLFSGDSKEDIVRKIPNLISLDMRQIIENVVEGGGAHWMNSDVTGRNAIVSRDSALDDINNLLKSSPRQLMLDLEVIFKLKLLRDKIDMKHELYQHMQRAFDQFNNSKDKPAFMEALHETETFIKDNLLRLKVEVKNLSSGPLDRTALNDLMKNTPEDQLIAAISGPARAAEIEQAIEHALYRPESDSAFSDPGVIRVFQEVMRGNFTPEHISQCRATLANVNKFQDFERLALCIVRIYEQMDHILDSLRSKHKEHESQVFKKLTTDILERISRSLSEKYYYKTELFKLIDDIFFELESVVDSQLVLRPSLEEQVQESKKAVERANFERLMQNRKTIDCGITKLSDLTRLSIHRLIPKVQTNGDVLFDVFAFEGNLRESIRRGLAGELIKDKYVFFYLNDKRKIKDYDFFKILLIEFSPTMQVQRTEICHFEGNPSPREKANIFTHEFYIEPSAASMLTYDPDFQNQIEVVFEKDVNLYDIQAKTLLAMFHLIYKEFHLNNLPSTTFNDTTEKPAEVMISVENLYDFFGFLRTGRTGSRYEPNMMKTMEANTIGQSNFLSQIPGTITQTQYIGEPTGRYDVHQSLLEVYGNPYNRSANSFKPQSTMRTADTFAQSRNFGAQGGRDNIQNSKLQSILEGAQRKLGEAADVNLRQGLNKMIPDLLKDHGQLRPTTDYDSTRRDELDRIRKDRDQRQEEERLNRDEREKQKREEQDRLMRERQEKVERDREDRERRKQEESKNREEQEQKDRLERESKDRERREREEQERKTREERDKREREDREVREKERRDREDKDRRDREDRAAKEKQVREEREAKEREDRDRREKADREIREKKEKEDKERRDRDRKDEEDRQAKLKEDLAQRRNKEEQDRAARELENAERKLRDEAERNAREEADRRSREEAEARRKQDETARFQKQQEEADRRRQEEDRRRQEEDRRRQEEADRLVQEKLLKAKQEEEYEQQMQEEAAENRRKAEADRVIREQMIRAEQEAEEEAEREAEIERERLYKLEQDRLVAEKRAQEEAERILKEESEREIREGLIKARREAEEAAERERLENETAEEKKKHADANKAIKARLMAIEKEAEEAAKIEQQQADEAAKRRLIEREAEEREQQGADAIAKARLIQEELDAEKELNAQNKPQDEFFDDFDDIDDFAESAEKKKPASPEQARNFVAQTVNNVQKKNAPADEEFNFDDIDDDFDDFGDSKGKAAKTPVVVPPKSPTPVVNPSRNDAQKPFNNPIDDDFDDDFGTLPAPKGKIGDADPALPPTKKNQVEDDFNEADDFDDLLDEFDGSKPKAAEPTKPATPKPADPVPEAKTNFAGGLRGLKKIADEQKVDPEKKNVVDPFSKNKNPIVLDNPHNHPRVMKSEHLPLIDQYIQETLPMGPEQVQDFMGELEQDLSFFSVMFAEFISNQLIFPLDFIDTQTIVDTSVEITKQNGRITDQIIDPLASVIQDVIRSSTPEGQTPTGVAYFLAPLLPTEDIAQESPVHAFLDMHNKQVLFVTINPQYDEESFRNLKVIQVLANILAKSVHMALNMNTNIEITPENIHLAVISEELTNFLVESCDNPYLRYATITYLALYENATDRYDFDGFKKSLGGVESYEVDNAFRFTSTLQEASQSLRIRQIIEAQPEILDGLMQRIEQVMSVKSVTVIPKMAEQLSKPEELLNEVKEDINQLIQTKKSGKEKCFAALEYVLVEGKNNVYFLCLQDNEPDILVYLASNQEPHNSKVLETIKSTLKTGLKKETQVYYEYPRHQFLTNQIDVFIYTWLLDVYTMNMPAIESLRILIYNEVPFIAALSAAEGDEEGAEEMIFDQGDSQERGVIAEPADGGDGGEFDDIDDLDFGDEMASKPKPKASATKIGSKQGAGGKPGAGAKQSNINYDEDDNFDDFDDDAAQAGNENLEDFDDLDF